MRPCPNCGQLVAESANFCHMCGERIPDVPETPPPLPPTAAPVFDTRPRFPRTGVWFLAIAAAVVIIAVAALLVLNDPEDKAPSAGGGQPGGGAYAAPAPQSVVSASGTVRLLVSIGNCEGCAVTAVPADDSAPQSATVVNGTAEFAIANRSTLGLGFTVTHPQGFGDAGGANVAVLLPLGSTPGESVSAKQVSNAPSVGICWAGTVASAASIPLAVEPHGDSTVTGGLRIWANPAQPVLDAMVAPSGDGTVEKPALSVCSNAVRQLGG